jgi:hypothetical protein
MDDPIREYEEALLHVVQAANALEKAKRTLREVALDAVEAGVETTKVAEAADIGRMTLWRWRQGEGADW